MEQPALTEQEHSLQHGGTDELIVQADTPLVAVYLSDSIKPSACNIHGIPISDQSYVADRPSEKQKYWLLTEQSTVELTERLQSANKLLASTLLRERARNAFQFPLTGTNAPHVAVPPVFNAGPVRNGTPEVFPVGVLGTVHYPQTAQLLNMADPLRDLEEQIEADRDEIAIICHTEASRLIKEIGYVLESSQSKPAECFTHQTTSPQPMQAMMQGANPYALMLTAGQHASVCHIIQSHAAPDGLLVSNLALFEVCVDINRPLAVTVKGQFRPTEKGQYAQHGPCYVSPKCSNMYKPVVQYANHIKAQLRGICAEIIGHVNRCMVEDLELNVLHDAGLICPITTALLLEPMFGHPLGAHEATEYRLVSNTPTNGETVLEMVAFEVKIVWPACVMSANELNCYFGPLVAETVRKMESKNMAVTAVIDVSDQGLVYGSGQLNGRAEPLLCNAVYVANAGECTGTLSDDLSVLCNMQWAIPGLGVVYASHVDQTGIFSLPLGVYSLMPLLCSMHPFGRPLLVAVSSKTADSCRVRGAIDIIESIPTAAQKYCTMVKENEIVQRVDTPMPRVQALIDILNGIHPHRARRRSHMFDVGNLAHAMTYGTLEGMAAWIQWILLHRRDSEQLAVDDLVTQWKFFGTHTSGRNACPLKTLLYKNHADESTASASPTGGKTNNAGTLTPSVIAFNRLFGMLRLDNPVRSAAFCQRQSAVANSEDVGEAISYNDVSQNDINSARMFVVRQFGKVPNEQNIATWLFTQLRDTVVHSHKDVWIFKQTGCHRWVVDPQMHQLRRQALILVKRMFAEALTLQGREVHAVFERVQDTARLVSSNIRISNARASVRSMAETATASRGRTSAAGGARQGGGSTTATLIASAVTAMSQRADINEDTLRSALPDDLVRDAASVDANGAALRRIGQIMGGMRGCSGVLQLFLTYVCDPEFVMRLDTINAIPFYNGVLCMQEKCLRPGRPTDYVSRGIWWSYEDKTSNDADVQKYELLYSRMLRYMDMIEQCADHLSVLLNVGNPEKMWTFVHGQTNGGKSVFLRWSGNAFGSLQTTLPVSEFTDRKEADAAAHTAHLVSAQGSRLAVIYEPQFGCHTFSLRKIKTASSNDPQNIRGLFGDTQQVIYTWHPECVSNTVAKLGGAPDDALALRLYFLWFGSTFTNAAVCPVQQEMQYRSGIFPVAAFSAQDFHKMGVVHMAHAFTNYILRDMGSPQFKARRSRRSILQTMEYMSDVTNLKSWLCCFMQPRCILGPVSRFGDRLLQSMQVYISAAVQRRESATDCETDWTKGSRRWALRVNIYTLFYTMWYFSSWNWEEAARITDKRKRNGSHVPAVMALPPWMKALPSQPHPWLPHAVNDWIETEPSTAAKGDLENPVQSLTVYLYEEDRNKGIVSKSGLGFNVLPVDEICNKYTYYRQMVNSPGSGDRDERGGGGGTGDQPSGLGEARTGGGTLERSSRAKEQHYGDGNSTVFNLDPTMFKRVVEDSSCRQIVDSSMFGCSVLDIGTGQETTQCSYKRLQTIDAIRTNKRGILASVNIATIAYWHNNGMPPLHIDALDQKTMSTLMMVNRARVEKKAIVGQKKRVAHLADSGTEPARKIPKTQDMKTVKLLQERFDLSTLATETIVQEGYGGTIVAWAEKNADIEDMLTQEIRERRVGLQLDTNVHGEISHQSPFEFEENQKNRNTIQMSCSASWYDAENLHSQMHAARLNEMNAIDENNTLQQTPYGFTKIGTVNAHGDRGGAVTDFMSMAERDVKQTINEMSELQAIGELDGEVFDELTQSVPDAPDMHKLKMLLADRDKWARLVRMSTLSQLSPTDDVQHLGDSPSLGTTTMLHFENSDELLRCYATYGAQRVFVGRNASMSDCCEEMFTKMRKKQNR